MTKNHEPSIKRIAIVGPECTGKTQLAMSLADHYQTVWVPEYARHYIDRLNRGYVQDDLLKIARNQLFTEDELALAANQLLFYDTNLVVIKVWSEFKFGNCDPEILDLLQSRHYDLHLLTNIDVPWENDPQREHPDKREYFYNLYKDELTSLGINFVEIKGIANERLTMAIKVVDEIL